MDNLETTDGATPRLASRSWRWSLFSVVILSLATLASAWSGYEAARWGSEQAEETRSATALGFAATRLSQSAERQRSVDVLIFGTWIEATLTGNVLLATEVEERFRPEFVPAFEAWIADSPPGDLPDGSPFDRPEYDLESTQQVEDTLSNSVAATQRADVASQIGDNFVLTTVLYASVLFLAGVSTNLARPRATAATVITAGVMFGIATAVMFTLPINVGW